MFTNVLASAALALAALNMASATIYTTSPTASTVAYGGQTINVSWTDDGTAPTLATIGQATIDLYVGSVNEQTWLQNLAAAVDVSKASYVQATIDPSIGASGAYYFVRYTSLAYTEAGAAYNYEQFSAKFTIDSMTGTFNATVLAQIDDTVSSSSSAVASKAASTTSKAASATSSHAASTSAKASASASASASAKAASGAERYAAPALMAVVVAVGAAVAF
ncbi:hypothetical protein Q5752_004722 [Cryptotrichosporon argae]